MTRHYCDMCDRKVESYPYVVDGHTFHWCEECVDDNGFL
jgi:ribosome-binding protein aMBF1 (putative translation factor)